MNTYMDQLIRSDEAMIRWKYASHLISQGHSQKSALSAAADDPATFNAEWIQGQIQIVRDELGLAPGEGPQSLPELWRFRASMQYRMLDVSFLVVDEFLAEGGTLGEEEWEEIRETEKRAEEAKTYALAHPEL